MNLFRSFSIGLFIVLCFQSTLSQTNLPGGNLSGTLSLTGSPFLVQGHVMVPPGMLLKIEPGVVLEFQGHYKLNVQGQLRAEGTVADSITFRVAPTLTATGWWGIRFEMTQATQDSSRLLFCKVSGSKADGAGFEGCGGGIFVMNFSKVRVGHSRIFSNRAYFGGGLFAHWASPIIHNNVINNNSLLLGLGGTGGGGIYCDSVAAPLIINNLISSNVIAFSGGGGGIGCSYSAPVISGNTITSNSADFMGGGGIHCRAGSSPLISNNLITYNSCTEGGAGINCIQASCPQITGNTISHNSTVAGSGSQGYGGGICCNEYLTNPVISNNLISYNSCTHFGGGIVSMVSALATITGNTIHSNNAGSSGGGISINVAGAVVQKNVLANNTCAAGGGIMISGTGTFVNNIIVNNVSSDNGGGIFCVNSSPLIVNCVIAYNKANTLPTSTTSLYGGGGLFCGSVSNPTIVNSIVCNNEAGSSNGHQVYLEDNASDPPFYNNMVSGGTGAFFTNGSLYSGTYTNNISVDPQFISPSGGTGTVFAGYTANWNVLSTSPCIGSGKKDTTGLFLPLTDMANNVRVKGYIDMGAYESGSCGQFIANTQITVSGVVLQALGQGSYQWMDCNSNQIIPGQTAANFTATVNGNYALQITQNACTDTSPCISVTTVDLSSYLPSSGVLIYPNPSKGSVFISGLGEGIKTIRVFDLLQREIVQYFTSDDETQLWIPTTGIYLLSVKSGSVEIAKKLVVE